MKKRELKTQADRIKATKENNDKYIRILSDMVNCKTVFTREGTNDSEYEKFYSVLEQSFPNLTEKAERLTFGDGCFCYIINGKDAKKNIMLMSHHDVVDGDDEWKTDPFVAEIVGDSLFGRGTIDTKTPLFAELQAAEELLAENYDFNGINLYIASSHNEEVCGDGAVLMAEHFKKNNTFFDVILDEGGAITEGMIPTVSAKSAVVAVHEKSRHLYKRTTKQETKGHGGLNPTTDNAIVRLAKFISAVDKAKIYKGKFYPEVKATFSNHVPFMKFPMNILFGNIGLFAPLLKKAMLSIPTTNAMLSTSISFTTIFAGSKEDPQMKAKEAYTTMFLRCIREDDLFRGLEKIKEIGKKFGVEIEEIERDYCKPTDFTKRPYKILEECLNENFPDVIVAPFLLTAGTDARRFTDIADSILRFAPIDLDSKQFASIHAANEHIKIENVGECVEFYKKFIKKI